MANDPDSRLASHSPRALHVSIGVASLLVGALAFMLFWPARNFDFVMFDDDINIFRNDHIGLLNAKRIIWMFSDLSYVRRYMPLGWLSFCTVVELNGFSPKGFHIAGIAIHAINASLYFIVLQLACRVYSGSVCFSRRIILPSVIALWWAFSPLRVEVVGWSSGLLYGISTTWLLLAFLFYLQSRECQLRKKTWCSLFSSLAFTASLITYPIMIGIAGAVVCLELYWMGCETAPLTDGAKVFKNILHVRVLSWIVPSAAAAFISFWALRHAPEFWREGLRAPFSERMLQVPVFFFHYVYVVFIPAKLLPVYDTLFGLAVSSPKVWAAAVGLFAVAMGGAIMWRSKPGVLLALAAIACVLIPVSPLVSATSYTSDRYAQPVGLILGVALLFIAIGRSSARFAFGVSFILGVHLLFFIPHTRQNLSHWENTDVLLSATLSSLHKPGPIRTSVAKRLANFKVYYQGDLSGALNLLSDESLYDPSEERAFRDGIDRLSATGGFRPVPCLDLYSTAVNSDLLSEDFRTAAGRLKEALRWCPEFWEAEVQLAFILLPLNRLDDSQFHFEHASKAGRDSISSEIRVQYRRQLEHARMLRYEQL